MPDKVKYCEQCKKDTIHTVSGSGLRTSCSECETSTEYGCEE